MATELSIEQARTRLLRGHYVRLTVGTDPEDPVLELRREGGMFVSNAIGGWSEGIEELICEVESDFIYDFLGGRARLEAMEPGE